MFRRKSTAALAGTLWIALAGAATAQAPPPSSPDVEEIEAAAARIERHRKADAVVVVVDAEGRPVPGAKVEVEQTRHAFRFGCNIFLWGRAGSPGDEAAYRERFAEVFNFATLPFYWPAYEPVRGRPAHDSRAEVARWCLDHGIIPKGHPLAWNFADPRWLPDDLDEIRRLQMARIDEIVARFDGVIDLWDVVNEATQFDREQTRNDAPRMTAMWAAAGREAFVLEAFRHARAANPDATLLINDYRTDDAYAALIRRLIEASGGTPPFDAIGIQSHMHNGTWPNAQIWEVCERFAAFGLPLHFTEATILSGEPGWELAREQNRRWPSTPEGERLQADEVERFYTMLFSHPAVEAITWWDFADRGAWQRAPAGFLRADLSPKPAYERLRTLVKERWWTRAAVETNPDGEAPFRAFLGEHRVTATLGDRTVEATLTVARGAENRVTLRLP